jgi:hypothetical protein
MMQEKNLRLGPPGVKFAKKTMLSKPIHMEWLHKKYPLTSEQYEADENYNWNI